METSHERAHLKRVCTRCSKIKWNQCFLTLFFLLLTVSPVVYVFTNLAIEPPTVRNPIDSIPTIYVVTATYKRLEQLADLTRLAQTLMLVPAVHWIVVEDNDSLSPAVAKLLERCPFPYTHLYAPMPKVFRKAKPPRPRGVSNRNRALDWIKKHASHGVIYFADDDNTYDIRLFKEMRHTKKVSMWPVGLIGHPGVSSPVVDPKSDKVIDFYDGWIGRRKFPVDMAGFAVNVAFFLKHPNVRMPFKPGYEEDGFLRRLGLNEEDIEPKAKSCSEILVWHTRTAPTRNFKVNATGYTRDGTNIDVLRETVISLYSA